MFTFKSKKLAVLAISCSLLLTACYPSGDQALSTEDNGILSGQIEDIVSDNEHLDAEVTLPAETVTDLPKINVKIMEWDEDQLKIFFFQVKKTLYMKNITVSLFPMKSSMYIRKKTQEAMKNTPLYMSPESCYRKTTEAEFSGTEH